MNWGERGRGKWVTVYTNPGHAFIVIAGLRFDTGCAATTFGASIPGSGPRWGKTALDARLHRPSPRRLLAGSPAESSSSSPRATASSRLVRSLPGGEARAYRSRSCGTSPGRTRDDALAVAGRLTARGLAVAVDFFGEDERDPVVAARVADDYVALAAAVSAVEGDV